MNKLKKLVNNSQTNQNTLAKKAGVSKGHMSRVINGERDLTFNISNKIYSDLGHNSPVALFLNAVAGFKPCSKAENIGNSGFEEVDKVIFDLVKNFYRSQSPSKAEMKAFIDKTAPVFELMKTKADPLSTSDYFGLNKKQDDDGPLKRENYFDKNN